MHVDNNGFVKCINRVIIFLLRPRPNCDSVLKFSNLTSGGEVDGVDE